MSARSFQLGSSVPITIRGGLPQPSSSSTCYSLNEDYTELDEEECDHDDTPDIPMNVLVSFKSPDYLKLSSHTSQVQISIDRSVTPITSAQATTQTLYGRAVVEVEEITQYELEKKGIQSYVSEIMVDGCEYVDVSSPQSSGVDEEDTVQVMDVSSPKSRPFVLSDGPKSDFLDARDQDIFMAFEDEGHSLSVFLYNLLQRAHAVHIREKSSNEFLADLDTWKKEVATAAIRMIYRTTNVYSHRRDTNAYERTTDFSVYFYWRCCKIAWDIEYYSTSRRPSDTKIFLPASALDVFISLWDAFSKAIHSDIQVDKQLSVESAQKGRFVSVLELLDQHVLFKDTPDLESLPDKSYQELRKLRHSVPRDEMDERNGVEQLRLLLRDFPVLSTDFERVILELNSTKRRLSQLSASSNYKSPRRHSRTNMQINIKTERPFQDYLARVIAYADRKTAKEVRYIYHNLVQGTESTVSSFKKLRRLFVGTPQLLSQFKDFVPVVAKVRWREAEDSVRTADQVSKHKRRLRLEWIRLIEEYQKKTGNELPWSNFVESMELEKLQTSMRFLQTAIESNPPFQSSLTPHAWSRIQILTKRLRRFTELVANAFTTLNTLTEEEKNEWTTSVRVNAASIAEELRRKSIAEIEKEVMNINDVEMEDV